MRISGEGPSTCRSLINLVGPVRLTLEQRSANLKGELSLFGSTSTLPVSGPIRGRLISEAPVRIALGGTLRQPEHAVEIRLVRWNTPLEGTDPPTLVGRFRVRRSFDNAFGRQTYDHTLEIQSLTQVASR